MTTLGGRRSAKLTSDSPSALATAFIRLAQGVVGMQSGNHVGSLHTHQYTRKGTNMAEFGDGNEEMVLCKNVLVQHRGTKFLKHFWGLLTEIWQNLGCNTENS